MKHFVCIHKKHISCLKHHISSLFINGCAYVGYTGTNSYNLINMLNLVYFKCFSKNSESFQSADYLFNQNS